MSSLTNIFSTRELAIFIWAIIALFLFTLNGATRKAIWQLIKTFFHKKIFGIFVLMVGYVSGVIFGLQQVALWDPSLLKDTAFWFFTVGMITFFKINNADDLSFFKDIVVDSVKLTVIVEFLVNFYTFGLGTEMMLVPLVIFFSLLYGYSMTDQKYEMVTKFFKRIITVFGLVVFLYVCYETIAEYNKTFTVQNLKSLLHPLILTVLFMPFAYCLALVMKYEILFIRIQVLGTDENMRKKIKREVLRQVKFNLNKLNRVGKNLTRFDFAPDDVKAFVKKTAEP